VSVAVNKIAVSTQQPQQQQSNKVKRQQQQSAIATTKERENRKRKAVDEIPISGFSKNFQIPFFLFF